MNQLIIAFATFSILVLASCKKEVNDTVYGCTVDYALNFNPEAEATDGSCKYAGQYVINSIKLVQFPVLDTAGVPWDPTDGPDVYFELSTHLSILISNSQPVVNHSGEYTWSLDPMPYIDADTNLYFNLKLFDDDGSGTLMGWMNPYFYDYTSQGSQSLKYPTVITVADDSVIMELHGSWIE